jgi:hypothetical protein
MMFKVLCTVFYADTGECHKRVINWDDAESKRDFAYKSDLAIRDGGKVTTESTTLPLGEV